MKLKYQIILLLCIITITACKQKNQSQPFKSIGDPAPPLRVRNWIKGTPVQSFEKGRVYVVEFWATWCRPCKAAMPHLSALAHQYKDKVTVVAIDIYEEKTTTIEKIKAVVGGMGNRMDFPVALEDTNFTVHDWLEVSGEKAKGIPMTFVIDAQGKVVWTGHPAYVAEVLPRVINNTWTIKDIKELISKRKADEYWQTLDIETTPKFNRYSMDKSLLIRKMVDPDSQLIIINKIVKKEPRLKYTPITARFTFSALLATNQHEAYEYGKKVMVTPTYDEPAYDAIIDGIRNESGKLNISPEIYRLGAECYQGEIDHVIYPELVDISGMYHKMAAWYKLAGDNFKAMEAGQKAVKFNTYTSTNSLN
jgi:thiol-disulfide isomerase/thioredoxin